MKTLSILFISLLIIITSCTKEEMQPQAAVNDAANASALKRSPLYLLTSHPWMYQKLIYFYDPSTGTGTVMYDRDSAHNTYPYDTYRFYYYRSGKYDEIDIYGNHFPGKWKFADGTNQTVVQVTYNNNPSSVYYNIKLLNAQHYNATYRVGYNTRYAEFIPASTN